MVFSMPYALCSMLYAYSLLMEEKINLSHGSGFKATREIIENIIKKYLGNEVLSPLADSAVVSLSDKEIAFTTDSYTVNPLFFKGSDIGKLAVYGTVNDLSVSGARPLFLSLGIIVEDGFSMKDFEKIIRSVKEAKAQSGVEIVCGDFKVVEKGKADKIFINTAGIGLIQKKVGTNLIEPGDAVIVNGFLGDHEISILLSRREFDFEADIKSDCAPLNKAIGKLIKECKTLKFMRDLTRGGLGVALNEVVLDLNNYGFRIIQTSLPVREPVKSICDLLGYDPLFLANEGKFMLVVSDGEKDKAVDILKKEGFRYSAAIGSVVKDNPRKVIVKTSIGGERILDYPYAGQLPRIC